MITTTHLAFLPPNLMREGDPPEYAVNLKGIRQYIPDGMLWAEGEIYSLDVCTGKLRRNHSASLAVAEYILVPYRLTIS